MPIKISDFDYLTHLKEQSDFLLSAIKQFEEGHSHFALKIAATLRTVFHSTNRSKSILPYLTDKYGINLIFRKKGNDFTKDPNVKMLINFSIGQRIIDHEYFNAPFFNNTDLETYWNDVVYIEGSTIYTRKQMILFAANKLGGSHVDPEIPLKLLKIEGPSSPKLISKKHGESTIITRVSYETSIQALNVIEKTIPILENHIL